MRNEMERTLNFRSHQKREHHIVIVGNFPNMEAAKAFKNTMRQAIQRQNRSSHKSSYEMHLQFNHKNV